MGERSRIEWTDRTWNPVTGCTKVSPGCAHCYAERITDRFHGRGAFARVRLHPDRLSGPLRWRAPSRVFVNSMSDLFHPGVPESFLARVFAVMHDAGAHTFQVLTKRPGRMRSLLRSDRFPERVVGELAALRAPYEGEADPGLRWPLPNLWLGVSVEDQQRADLRVPALLDTPAAVRFLSCEPLLGPVQLRAWLAGHCPACDGEGQDCPDPRCTQGVHRFEGEWIDWVIAGGESGPGARPMRPEWARSLREQCTRAGVAFFFKQWGEWAPTGPTGELTRVGRKRAGRVLDGRTWDQIPQGVSR